MALNNLSRIDALVSKGLQKAVLRIEASAKANAPVDTGNLRASIDSEVNGLVGMVGSNVNYAGFVEMGTSRHRPQPFLYPALMENRKNILKDIADAVKGGIR